MPVKVVKRGDKFRVVEASNGRLSRGSNGAVTDGGGHSSREKAQRQANAINRGSK